jgi:hypothetical protein
MARRSTPDRIDQARRAAVRASLIGDDALRETADAWIAAWEALAAEDGLERARPTGRPAWSGSPRSGSIESDPDGV